MWLLLVLCSLLLASPAWSANTWYVDKENRGENGCNNTWPGTFAQPRCSVIEGLKLLAKGDTLFIRGGTYAEYINPVTGAIPSGTSDTNRTTIAGYLNEMPTIARMTLGDGGGFAWLLFANFRIDGTLAAPPGTNGVNNVHLGGDSHHITFDGMDFKDGPWMALSGGGGFHVFKNSQVHGAWYYGAYFGGHDTVFEHNDFYDNGGYAFHIYETGATNVSNNVVHSNRVRNNGLRPGAGSGAGGLLVSHGTNNQVYNNLVYGNIKGIEVYDGCVDCKVYNNTVYGTTVWPGIKIGGNLGNPWPTGTIVQNNILANNAAPGIAYAFPGITATIDHNLCPTSGDNCDVVGNPSFVGPVVDVAATPTTPAIPANFRLNPDSDARNRGVPISTVTSSFYGAARRLGSAYDIGAAASEEGGGQPPNGQRIYVRKPPAGNDSNDCFAAESPANAKATIKSALGCMVVPGKMLFVETGTYTEEIDTLTTPITGGNGPSFADATRIEGYGAGPVILQSPVSGNVTLFLRHPSSDKYLIFKKLVIDGANRTFNTVALYSTAHHIRFDQVEVKNTLSGGREGIYLSDADNIELVDVFVHDTGTDALRLEGSIDTFLCQRCHLYSAITKGLNISASGTKSNITIRESEIRNNTTDGADIGASTGTVVQNLLAHSNGGIGVRIRTGAASTKIYNNTVYSNTGNGVQCDAGATSTEIKDNIVYSNGGANNIVNNCGATVQTPP